jgi:hypothetical protein
MSSLSVFLTVRTLHVLAAALWFGATVLFSLFLLPAVRQADTAGGRIMVEMSRRGLTKYMPSIAGTTVLTGFLLYWRFTAGFDAHIANSFPGLVFGAGAFAGTVAFVVGGAVIGRSVDRIVTLSELASGLPAGAEQTRHLQEAAELHSRAAGASKVVAVLLAIALVLMAVGHYV